MDERQQDIRKEMEEYLSSRKKNGFLGLFKKEEEDDELSPDMETYGEEDKSVFGSIIDSVKSAFNKKPKEEQTNLEEEFETAPKEHIEPDFEEFEEEQEKDEIGFFARLFRSKKEEESELEVKEDCKEDLKKIAKFCAELLKKVPSDELKKIKFSNEFSEFKQILDRNELIKK